MNGNINVCIAWSAGIHGCVAGPLATMAQLDPAVMLGLLLLDFAVYLHLFTAAVRPFVPCIDH